MIKEELDKKYIKLLLERCINFKKSKKLFINYNNEAKDFVSKINEYCKNKGIEVYLDEYDPFKEQETLEKLSLEEIESCSLFDKSIWDEYARQNASFLMLDTETPGVMENIDPNKVALASKRKRETRPLFREKEGKNEISWCIAAYPGELWAKSIFPNDEKAYDKLYEVIGRMCMLDKENPIESWNKYIKESQTLVDKLNNLKITQMHYTNSKGTDLYITLPKNHIWVGAGNTTDMLVNMPSYEIFTSPDYRYTEGIVFNAKPLIYNGISIEDFSITFKEGKAISCEAKKGKEVLQGIIESDSNSCYLGEVSLINHNSPISNTGIIFGTTLFDENASCHLALGDSFPECIEKGLNKSKKELLSLGLNDSKTHVDFMIGTEDLNIIAETAKGPIQIFKNGDFCI